MKLSFIIFLFSFFARADFLIGTNEILTDIEIDQALKDDRYKNLNKEEIIKILINLKAFVARLKTLYKKDFILCGHEEYEAIYKQCIDDWKKMFVVNEFEIDAYDNSYLAMFGSKPRKEYEVYEIVVFSQAKADESKAFEMFNQLSNALEKQKDKFIVVAWKKYVDKSQAISKYKKGYIGWVEENYIFGSKIIARSKSLIMVKTEKEIIIYYIKGERLLQKPNKNDIIKEIIDNKIEHMLGMLESNFPIIVEAR